MRLEVGVKHDGGKPRASLVPAYALPAGTHPELREALARHQHEDPLGEAAQLQLFLEEVGLDGAIRALEFGAEKYAAHNWVKVEGREQRYRDALYRHELARVEGQKGVRERQAYVPAQDEESGLAHADHRDACAAMLLHVLLEDA